MKRDGRDMGDFEAVTTEQLTERFEAARPRLRRMALRMLGATGEADDALQESWIRIARADHGDVENLDGWLTTVVARSCLDALKRRESRREEFTTEDPRRQLAASAEAHPEDQALLADAVGVALRILLDALNPAERVAFVLHDLFDVPFDDVAAVVGRSTEAARQLASRARRRVRGATPSSDPQTRHDDELVRAFLQASRSANFPAMLALLDPGATLRADAAVVAMGGAAYWQTDRLGDGISGAEAVAHLFSGRANAAQAVLLDGRPGALWMHDGEPRVAFRFTIHGDRIGAIELVADADALASTKISGLPSASTE